MPEAALAVRRYIRFGDTVLKAGYRHAYADDRTTSGQLISVGTPLPPDLDLSIQNSFPFTHPLIYLPSSFFLVLLSNSLLNLSINIPLAHRATHETGENGTQRPHEKVRHPLAHGPHLLLAIGHASREIQDILHTRLADALEGRDCGLNLRLDGG